MTDSSAKAGRPSYRDLERREARPVSWAFRGGADVAGAVGEIDAASVVRAASLVKKGKIFGLDYAVDAFDPEVYKTLH